jgi:hypothetical protein
LNPEAGPDNGSSSGPETDSKVHIAIQMVTYVKGPPTGKKGQIAEKKEMKTKDIEHIFADDEDNYIALLATMLSRHSKSSLMSVAATSTYPFKLQIPPSM